MTEQRPPEDGATIEDITTPSWDRSTRVPDDVTPTPPADGGGRRRAARPGIRWLAALVGIIVVAAGSAVIVSLAGGRPATSVALGYMPAETAQYVEIRLDLPGDQRQKLAAFLAKFPGFADQSQIQPKIEDVLDRLVRAASAGKQTWTANIQPWFGGQIAVGQGGPASITSAAPMSPMGPMSSMSDALVVTTVSDRAKAVAWLTSLDGTSLAHSTYNGADLFTPADQATPHGVVAVTDKVMIAGEDSAVKAAIDGNGAGPLAQNADIKAALATVDRDYVVLTVSLTQPYLEGLRKLVAAEASPGLLDQTKIDDTLLAMIPAWSAAALRFEDDALVATSTAPAGSIGYDGANRASAVANHVPANALVYSDVHDAGPAFAAIVAKFRALPETKPFFDQADQALSVVGGFDAAFGWWGDTAIVVTPGANGTVGGGLVVKPRDPAAAERLFTTLGGFVQLAGGSSGIALRTEDHGGTKISIVDFSAALKTAGTTLPAGYKPELAWATNADITVVGIGRDFVASVLDAGNGSSLADDARYRALLNRVGAENIAVSYVDMTAIRKLVEPLAKANLPADVWTKYDTEYRLYLEPIDALIQATRKDGQLDRSTGALTVH